LSYSQYLIQGSHPLDTDRIAYLEPIAKLQAAGKSEQEIRQSLRPWWNFWSSDEKVETTPAPKSYCATGNVDANVKTSGFMPHSAALYSSQSRWTQPAHKQLSKNNPHTIGSRMRTIWNRWAPKMFTTSRPSSTLTDRDVMCMGF
jgi:hypothetical protein